MPRMDHRRLGDSDLEVSEISLGSWLTYSGGVGRDQTEACTRAAFDAGITFFDTANVYGRGAAEEVWGEVLADHDRDSYVLATKVYFPMSDTDRGLSSEQIHKQVDDSLRRLRTDFVDLYQCHRYDTETPLEETVRALSEVVRAGKARYWGFSEWTAEQIDAALALARDEGLEKPVSSQPQYSLLWRRIEDNGVLRISEDNGISQIVWSPLAQGVLTGKYRPGEPPPEGTRAASEEMGGFISGFFRDDVLDAVQRLGPIAEQAGLSLAQLALAWILREPGVASAIIGATRPEQVAENAAAAGVELGDDVLRAIDEALGDAARLGDEDR
jgi:aryl-alcohol dehydrogenase-like predicted oxidoreductase